MIETQWIEHRRGRDAELVGWVVPRGDDFVAVDLLGQERTGPVDWHEAEATLEGLGLAYLADPYELTLDDGTRLAVRITEVSAESIRLKEEDYGAIDAPLVEHALPFPPGDRLRPASARA